MHNPESVLKNEMHKVLWDFEIQIDHLISARRPDLVIVNKNRGFFSLSRSWYLSLFLPSFIFTLNSAGTAKYTIGHVFIFC